MGANHVQVVRVTSAAKVVDVDRRTVYQYIKPKKSSELGSLKVRRSSVY